jgi:3-oxoacyl-[acyl-carrier protein] reductase
LGGVDILVNNAGIGDFGTIEEMPSETWEQVIKTNYSEYIMLQKPFIHL